LVVGNEHWWLTDRHHQFKRYFMMNLNKYEEKPRHTSQQKLLLEYFKNNQKAKNELFDHNKNTRFLPKHKEGKVIIPYIVHQIWLTKPDKPRVMNYTNVWEMVKAMGDDVEHGVTWKHYFWTNHKDSIVLDEDACGGRCEVKLLDEMPGYSEIKDLIDRMIDVKFYSIDLLKPYIIEAYGGVYLDCDFYYERSWRKLHTFLDSYTGSEGNEWTGLAAGIVGARPFHPAITIWKEVLMEYYGYRDNKWGA